MSAPSLALVEPVLKDQLKWFTLDRIKIRFLPERITLNAVLPEEERGPKATWEAWQQEYRQTFLDLLRRVSDESFGDEESLHLWECRRLLGTLMLEREVLDAVHKMLFGAVTDEPTAAAVQLVADALFTEDHLWNSCDSWLLQLIRKAERHRLEQDHKIAALNKLLQVLEA